MLANTSAAKTPFKMVKGTNDGFWSSCRFPWFSWFSRFTIIFAKLINVSRLHRFLWIRLKPYFLKKQNSATFNLNKTWKWTWISDFCFLKKYDFNALFVSTNIGAIRKWRSTLQPCKNCCNGLGSSLNFNWLHCLSSKYEKRQDNIN